MIVTDKLLIFAETRHFEPQNPDPTFMKTLNLEPHKELKRDGFVDFCNANRFCFSAYIVTLRYS
jgi:hypothetical protein